MKLNKELNRRITRLFFLLKKTNDDRILKESEVSAIFLVLKNSQRHES